jgi:transposase
VDEERLRRHDLSDAEWARLEPLLPQHPCQGHRWNDHRMVINGIFWTRTGCPSRDLPDCFGNWKTVYDRHRRWSGGGTWELNKAIARRSAVNIGIPLTFSRSVIGCRGRGAH